MSGEKSMHILLVFITTLVYASAIQFPHCQASFFYQTLPLVSDQSFIMDLDAFFGGFNLQYSIDADQSLQKYISLKPKQRKQKEEFPDKAMTGLKSHHLSRIGNSWAQQFITLSESKGKILVHYGILNDNSTVPVINNYITVVQDSSNTSCFDAVLFPQQDRIIVDCVQKRTAPGPRGQIYDNIFYYFKISNKERLNNTRKTEMFVPFTQIVRRRVEIYKNDRSKHNFLLRTYFADGMSVDFRDNTYTEIFMIDNPDDPWTVGIIDRSFLGLSRLRIMDVKVYLGKIYILDFLKGVFQVEITNSQDFDYLGNYEAKSFTRLGVFSSNLDNYLQFVLANDHSIHEVDWTEVDTPRLINKYSFIPGSTISQVFLNTRFVVLQAVSKQNGNTYFYTWILNRGDRTYSRAFNVIKHDSANVLIDLNQDYSYLLVMNQSSISNYAFDKADLVFTLDKNEDLYDKISSFTINALSFDPTDLDQNVTCSLQLNFTLLDEYNRTMWPIGSAPPNFYNANYPGKVKIDLFEYVIGPNVTYKIQQTVKDQLKKAKVYQQDQLNITWKNTPPFDNITFLQTRTIHNSGRDTLIIYMQDINNLTYITYCYPDHEELDVTCNRTEAKDVGGKVTNWATTIYYSPFTQSDHHVLAYSTDKYYNKIFIEDLSKERTAIEVNLGKSFPGNITSLTISNRHLYVVLKHIKRINVYPLQQCLKGEEYCDWSSYINHINMFKLGLRYFAPQSVHASLHHPDLLFVKTSDSIIIVDMSKDDQPRLLTIVNPVKSSTIDFAFEVNSNFMVVTIAPNVIQEYDLSRVYLKEVRITKKYPLYGYKLPKNYEFDLSDYGNCVYLSTLSEGGVYNVFVYRSGYPAVGTLYNQINLFAFQNILIDASGYIVDYVTVVSGKELRLFRQYQFPEAQIINPKVDYTFNLQYFNILETAQLQVIEVKIINLPTYIKVNPFLLDIMNTKDLLFSGPNKLNEINDTDWYEGNVLYIEPTCPDCGSKIKIYNHIQDDGITPGVSGMTDYVYNRNGGSAQTVGGLVSFQTNGSIGHIVHFPHSIDKRCLQIDTAFGFEVSGCVSDDAVYLYLTSFVSSKPFALPPFETEAENLFKIQSAHQILILVDTQPDAYRKSKKGGIFVYQISGDDESQQPLIQLEYLSGQDFGMRELGDIFINNAQLTYNPTTKVYRLYISEMRKGLFMIQFTHIEGNTDLVIRQIVYIDLKTLLSQLKQTLPYDATFQAIAVISSVKTAAGGSTQRLLVTTGRYNTIQVDLTYSSSSTLLSKKITRIYLRYSYYEVENHISHTNDLFLVKQLIPDDLNDGNHTPQLYTVYSTRDNNRTDLEHRGLIGAYPIMDNSTHRFDFNLTIDPKDLHSEPRTGVVIVESEKSKLDRATLHRNLSLFTSELLDTQIIYIDLINDFNREKIRILINGIAPFPEWKLITIILFSIIGFLLLIGAGIFAFKRWKNGQGVSSEQRQTLITQSNDPLQ